MKCCSRSILGVIIGILNVVTYLASIILIIYSMVEMNMEFKIYEKFESSLILSNVILSILLIICMTMFVASGLLLVGIIKRRHKLMVPWLIQSAILFVLKSLYFVYIVIYSANNGSFMEVFFVGTIGIVLFGLFLWYIYTLYKDIEKQDTIQPTLVNYQTGYGY